jgi:glycogen synthase
MQTGQDNRPLKIAFLTPEYVTPASADGGLANYLKKTGAALAKNGIEVCIFVASNRNDSWQDGKVTVYEVNINSRLLKLITRLPVLGQFKLLLNQLFSLHRLAAHFQRVHRHRTFDLIQASSYQAPGFFLRKNKNIPIVCRVSSYTPLLRSAYGQKRSFEQYLSDWLEIRQVVDADSSFAPSRFVAEVFERMEAHSMAALRTIIESEDVHHDLDWFAVNRPNGRYLLFFGTLSQIKGVDLLAVVIPKILERYPDLLFVFIGRDDGLPQGGKVFKHIRKSCESCADRVFYYPSQNKQRLYPFIANAEAVVMPSRVDNYPNACLEAQMFGKPVIGTYESSLDEMIVDGETGFLSRNGDTESLFKAIERLMGMSPEERKAMTKRILEEIEKIKAEDRIGMLITYYQTVISKFKQKSL